MFNLRYWQIYSLAQCANGSLKKTMLKKNQPSSQSSFWFRDAINIGLQGAVELLVNPKSFEVLLMDMVI